MARNGVVTVGVRGEGGEGRGRGSVRWDGDSFFLRSNCDQPDEAAGKAGPAHSAWRRRTVCSRNGGGASQGGRLAGATAASPRRACPRRARGRVDGGRKVGHADSLPATPRRAIRTPGAPVPNTPLPTKAPGAPIPCPKLSGSMHKTAARICQRRGRTDWRQRSRRASDAPVPAARHGMTASTGRRAGLGDADNLHRRPPL